MHRNEQVGLHLPQSAKGAQSRRAGVTMIEVMISITILVVASGALVSAMISHVLLGELNEEMSIAEAAGRRMLEEIEDAEFSEVFALYNTDPADDPVGGAPGPGFAVLDLGLRPGDPDGFIGRVVVPETLVGGLAELRENIVDEALGMPRDLDLDGAVDAVNHAADYRVLPVRVLVEWSGATGPKQLELQTLLFNQN